MKNRIDKKSLAKKALLLAAIAAAAYACSAHWCQLMVVRGNSMSPAYRDMQLVVLQKQFSSLRAGDVAAFWCEGAHALLVKRIVAVPGDQVQVFGGGLYVNGVRQETRKEVSYAGIASQPLLLGEDEYFMLGDNYGASKDSRHPQVGCVRERDIIGRVLPAR